MNDLSVLFQTNWYFWLTHYYRH